MNTDKIIISADSSDTYAEQLRKQLHTALKENHDNFSSPEVIAASERCNEYFVRT